MNETLRYTQLGLAVAGLLAKEELLDAGQARQYIEDGSLFSWLGRRYDGEIDLSLYEAPTRPTSSSGARPCQTRSIPSARSRSATSAGLGFHADRRYSLIRPASLACAGSGWPGWGRR